MLKPDTICTITNRSPGSVLYKIPESNIRREFNARETKKVPYAEILAVASQPGGRELLYNFFFIKEEEAVTEALNVKPEIEYFMTEDQIPGWINSCSIDEFKDALDFAPEGIKGLIKQISVTLPLNDMAKREALLDQLGFDCTKAIENEKLTQAQDPDVEPIRHANERRVTSAEEPKQITRRIITKKEG